MSNLSEEEKEALNYFKKGVEETKELGKKYGFQVEIKNNDIILNLIDRLQKELEQEKEKTANIQEQKMQFYNRGVEVTNKWWQDKIKDKIKELKKDMVKNGAIIDILYEILEGE